MGTLHITPYYANTHKPSQTNQHLFGQATKLGHVQDNPASRAWDEPGRLRSFGEARANRLKYIFLTEESLPISNVLYRIKWLFDLNHFEMTFMICIYVIYRTCTTYQDAMERKSKVSVTIQDLRTRNLSTQDIVGNSTGSDRRGVAQRCVERHRPRRRDARRDRGGHERHRKFVEAAAGASQWASWRGVGRYMYIIYIYMDWYG